MMHLPTTALNLQRTGFLAVMSDVPWNMAYGDEGQGLVALMNPPCFRFQTIPMPTAPIR